MTVRIDMPDDFAHAALAWALRRATDPPGGTEIAQCPPYATQSPITDPCLCAAVPWGRARAASAWRRPSVLPRLWARRRASWVRASGRSSLFLPLLGRRLLPA